MHSPDLRLQFFGCLAGFRQGHVALHHRCGGPGGEGHFGALGHAVFVGVTLLELGQGEVAFFFAELVAAVLEHLFGCAEDAPEAGAVEVFVSVCVWLKGCEEGLTVPESSLRSPCCEDCVSRVGGGELRSGYESPAETKI